MKAFDLIITNHNTPYNVLTDNSISSIKRWNLYFNQMVFVSNENIEQFPNYENLSLIVSNARSKLDKIKEGLNFLNKSDNFVIILDSDDQLTNIDRLVKETLSTSDDILLFNQNYLSNNYFFERRVDYRMKDWTNIKSFPYFGNQTLITKKTIISESINDMNDTDWQRGEDGFRMTQYFSKSDKITYFDFPFTNLNRQKQFETSSSISLEQDNYLKDGIFKKFEELRRLLTLGKIEFWHLSQYKWIEFEMMQYSYLIPEDLISEIKRLINIKTKFKLLLTIFSPKEHELSRWDAYDLGKDLIILDDSGLSNSLQKVSKRFNFSQLLTFNENLKRFNLVKAFVDSWPEFVDIKFHIIDPDDYIELTNFDIFKNIVETKLFNQNLILHKASKIYDKSILTCNNYGNFRSFEEFLLSKGKPSRTNLTYETCESVHSTRFLKTVFSKYTGFPSNLQFQDDKFFTFLYLSNKPITTYLDKTFYIQIHENGQTGNLNNFKFILEDTNKIYDFALRNDLTFTYTENSGTLKKYLNSDILKEVRTKNYVKNAKEASYIKEYKSK